MKNGKKNFFYGANNKRKTGNNGITLIALVITIIVLLILAGVTIAMLTGQNGILTRATGTNAQNAYSQATEKAKLAYMAVRMEIMTAKVTDVSYDATKRENALKLKDLVANELTGTEWTQEPIVLNEANNTITMTYNNSSLSKDGISVGKPAQDGKIIFEIVLDGQEAELYIDGLSSAGELNPTAGFGKVNSDYAEYFGKKVNGYKLKDGTVENGLWRLFYADGNSVYLIRDSSFIGNRALNSLPWFDNSIEISKLGKNLNKKFTSWDLKSDAENLNNNIKAVVALLNTTKWEDYKADYAIWAIGAPTLELFIESYNATHTMQLDCKVETDVDTGYKVGKNTKGKKITNFDTIQKSLGNTENIDKAIYCGGNSFMWLASPSAYNTECLMYVFKGHSGRIDSLSYDAAGTFNSAWGGGNNIRPIVRIPLSKVGTEITITDEY